MVNTIWKEALLIMCSSLKENARNTERFSLALRITDNYALQTLCCSPHNICNDEGNINGLPLNRAIYDSQTNELLDIIAGNFFLVGTPTDSDSLHSLTLEQQMKYSKIFKYPERFTETYGKISAEKYKPFFKENER